MTEIARREAEARKAMEARYEKFRQELAAAYSNREKVDNENFDKISEINYGITAATEEVVGLDTRVLIANLKSKEAANMLMPVPEDKKKLIEADIEADRKKVEGEIRKKYDELMKKSEAAAKRYEEADKLVKLKEAEKAKLRMDQAEALKKLEAEQEAIRAKMKKEADDAVEIAKEKQKQEMVGMIVKALLGVGIVLMVLGFLLKSPLFIVGGLVMLGLSFVAATIPFWVVSAIMGVFIVSMIVMMHPKAGGKFTKKTPPSEPPAPPAPPSN
jgi:predicted phage tail protein